VKVGRSQREKYRLCVLENRVLRRIFGPKRDEVTGEWRRLHNKKLYALYSSPNIIRVIKLRRLRWAGRVARMGERRGAYRALVGKPEGRNHLEDPGVDGRIILKWIFERLDGGHGLDRSGSGSGQVAGFCKYGDEPSGSIKCGEFLE
jgi:hypothetical protein